MKAVFLCLFVFLCCLIGYFRSAANLALSRYDTVTTAIDLPRAQSAKLVALGFDNLLFDYYWLEFIQYIGDQKGRQSDHSEKAASYLELLTAIDPHFVPAYYFAAITLGDQNQSAAAAAIIDRGIAANPDNWLLPYIGGMNQFLFAHDEHRAAKYYKMAARFPAAPDWLERQANILEAKIPSMIKEINVWDSMYHNSTSPEIKQRAQNRLVELWLKVYKTAPTKTIKERALNQLRDLGVELDEKSVHRDTEI